jgi:uncharacterized membrane protein YesL
MEAQLLKFFSIDSPIYKAMCAITNIFLLNLCWIIGSIPIVTAGASTIAAFDVALRMVDGEEGYIFKQFFKAYKNSLKQGIILEILTIICAYVVWLDFQIFNVVDNNPVVFLILGVLTLFLFVFSLLYAYPQAARYENTVPRILKNSFRISMKYFVRSLIIVILVILETVVFLWNTMFIFIGVIVGPACIIYTISAIAKPIFKKIEQDTASA